MDGTRRIINFEQIMGWHVSSSFEIDRVELANM